MKNIPTFEAICELFENKNQSTWNKVKPFISLGLILAPGVLLGSLGTVDKVFDALDRGLNLSGAMEHLESVLFPFTDRFRKKHNYSSPYDLPRLANTMVIFSAWFSVLEEKARELWDNLELDEAGFRGMEEKCRAEYQKVQKLLGGDGRNILLPDGEGDRALERLYSILKDRTRHLAQGLVATEHLPVEWEALPSLAVKKYHRHCEILQKYDDYRNWVGQQYLEQILKNQQEQKAPPPHEPERLHLPAVSSLLDRELFHGREDLLHTIETDFLRRNTVILRGLGGIGKTELAIAYGRRRPDPQRVYFLPFRTDFKETVAIGVLAGMAEYADQKLSVEDAFPIAMNRLRECSREDLLILDNVDASLQSLNGVIRAVGALPMQCLITTRHETHGAIEVDRLPEKELLKIFDDYEAPVSPEDRLSLIHAVDRHTLTVGLIAATLSSGMVKAKTLLEALEEQNLEDILLPEVDAHYPGAEEQKKIYGHLRTVFRVTNMSDAAEKALCCATLLPHSGVRALSFQAALEEDAAQALFSLAKNGWLDWHDDLITLHPVIRLVCKTELKPGDESCGHFLDQLNEQFDPNNYDHNLYRRLAEVFEIASKELEDKEANYASHAGFMWNHLGDYNRALEFNKIALNIWEKVLPEDHPDLATAYNNVGYTYGALGDHDKELEFMLKALKIREKVLPEDHPDLAQCYNNVGSTYGDLGDHNKELEFMLKALMIREKVLPEDHPDLATAYNNVGSTYGALGDHKKALEFKQKALKIWEKVLPEDHPDLALSYNNAGITYGDLGDHNKALEFKQKALKILEKVLPEDHPDLAISYNNVGYTYGALGDHNKALEFMLKALKIQEKVLSEDHPYLALSYNNVGGTYGALGDHKKALEFMLKALKIWEKVLPEDHPHLATAYNNVGGTYGALGDHKKALGFMLKALKSWEKVLPEDHPHLALSYYNVGYTYDALGDHNKALEFMLKALKIREKLLPEDHPDIAMSCSNIAFTLGKLGQFEKALPYIQRAVTIGAHSLPEGHPHPENYRKGMEIIGHGCKLQEMGIEFRNPFL